MADTGFVIAGAGANVNTGDQPWANPSRITADDGSASETQNSQQPTDTLKASSFGFAIPLSATIRGIEVRAQLANIEGEDGKYNYANVGKTDSTLGAQKTTNITLTGSYVNYDRGGPTDLWGLTWTAAEINASTFQARIRCDEAGGFGSDAFGCDAIWCKIYYDPVLEATVGAFTFTGGEAGLGSGASVSGDPGAFGFIGQAATLLFTQGGLFIVASVGAFLIVEGITQAVLTVKRAIAKVVQTTYAVRPLLTKLRARPPKLDE